MKKILALDMGGTSVKAAVYVNGKSVANTLWQHDYGQCGLEAASSDLLSKIKEFGNKRYDAVGLSVAGLVGTDGSLYRSTVLTSFEGFNIPQFLEDKLGTEMITIDNDADCGAMSAWQRIGKNFFYVIVGSGIGSAYINNKGALPYKVRFSPGHCYTEMDNPVPNDLGLQVSLPKKLIYHKFDEYAVSSLNVEKYLIDIHNQPLIGPYGDVNSVRIGQIGSAVGLNRIIHILLDDMTSNEHLKIPIMRNLEKGLLGTGEMLCTLAKSGNMYAQNAFKIFGSFLGYGIKKAAMVIRSEHSLRKSLDVRLSGPIMKSYMLFADGLIVGAGDECLINLTNNPSTENLHGAYIRASLALKDGY